VIGVPGTGSNCEKCFKNVGGREFPAAGTGLPRLRDYA